MRYDIEMIDSSYKFDDETNRRLRDAIEIMNKIIDVSVLIPINKIKEYKEDDDDEVRFIIDLRRLSEKIDILRSSHHRCFNWRGAILKVLLREFVCLNLKIEFKIKSRLYCKMSKNCNICTESFNKTNRALVKCMCDFECCRMCAKGYLMSRKDPSCMECKVGWSRKFMADNFEKTFMTKQYRDHRAEVLVEREIGMLQATQPYVEREIRMEKLEIEMERLKSEYLKLEGELKELRRGEITDKKKFVRKCPNDNCHGFLSMALKCELCDCWACSECREVKGFTSEEKESHECNKEILESVKLLDKDSKPCPKCAAMICKIDGCDQIWCVECHTAFSWRTLKIENGVIHNPHYFEYQIRLNNGMVSRNPLDIQCGRELDHNFINSLIKKFILPNLGKQTVMYDETNRRLRDFENEMVEICRKVIHMRHVDIPRFRVGDRLTSNLKLRINYMRNKIDKNDLKKLLQKREKENLKKDELSEIMCMYVSVMTDIMYRVLDGSKNDMMNEMNEMNELRMYTNSLLENVSKTYNCKKYEINKKFYLI